MPLDVCGIRFEHFPEKWTSDKMFPSMTLEQCEELEAYWDRYPKNRRPIPNLFWQQYFSVDGKNRSQEALINNVRCWKLAKQNFERDGLPEYRHNPDLIFARARLEKYQILKAAKIMEEGLAAARNPPQLESAMLVPPGEMAAEMMQSNADSTASHQWFGVFLIHIIHLIISLIRYI